MRELNKEEAEARLGKGNYQSVRLFYDAVREELKKYIFAWHTVAVAEVRFDNTGAELEFPPNVYVTLTWESAENLKHTFEAFITLPELVGLLSEYKNTLVWTNYVYHFARLLISSLALTRVPGTCPVSATCQAQGE